MNATLSRTINLFTVKSTPMYYVSAFKYCISCWFRISADAITVLYFFKRVSHGDEQYYLSCTKALLLLSYPRLGTAWTRPSSSTHTQTRSVRKSMVTIMPCSTTFTWPRTSSAYVSMYRTQSSPDICCVTQAGQGPSRRDSVPPTFYGLDWRKEIGCHNSIF